MTDWTIDQIQTGHTKAYNEGFYSAIGPFMLGAFVMFAGVGFGYIIGAGHP